MFAPRDPDDYLLDTERSEHRRAAAIAARDEPSLEAFLPTRGDGLVLSAKKVNPTIEMPLVASLDGKNIDPLFAHWQAGLGKSAAEDANRFHPRLAGSRGVVRRVADDDRVPG